MNVYISAFMIILLSTGIIVAHAQVSQDFGDEVHEDEVKYLATAWFKVVREVGNLIGESLIFGVRAVVGGNVDIDPDLAKGITFAFMTFAPALIIFLIISKVVSKWSKWVLIILIIIFAAVSLPVLNASDFLGNISGANFIIPSMKSVGINWKTD